jgi:archaemetzincin
LKYALVILLVITVSCNGKKETDPGIAAQAAFFRGLASNDVELATPREGEWLYTHKEPGQTFEQYKKAKLVHPVDSAHTIYLQPLGVFSTEQQRILRYTVQYLEIFFQLKVELAPVIADDVIPANARRIRGDGTEQLLAPYILDTLLKHKLPAHAVVLMMVTEKDLYPKDDWNFIFGLASYTDRVGVSSMKRLYYNLNDSNNFKLCLTRMIAVTSHEIGHMFSLHHCINAKCVMNGSNSLAETDLQPNRLCAECLKKLYWSFRFNNMKRLQALQQYFKEHGLGRDYLLAKNDWDKVN